MPDSKTVSAPKIRYLTSRGAGTIPPELTHLIYLQYARLWEGPGDRRSVSEGKKAEAQLMLRDEGDSEPRILYGSVASGQATSQSDTDLATPQIFITQKIALFSPFDVLNATDWECVKILGDIKRQQEQELMAFVEKNYRGNKFSSADLLLDYLHSNVCVAGRAETKRTSYEVEEARLVRGMLGAFLSTLYELVRQGKLKRFDFHEYQQ